MICTIGALLARGIWIVPALLPFFMGAGADGNVVLENASTWLLLLIAFSSIFNAGIGTVWTAWMGNVVPKERRGRYFGMRNGIHAVVGLTANLAAGVILDHVSRPLNHQLVFMIAVTFALIGINMYRHHYQPAERPQPVRLRETLAIPLHDGNFRRFLAFAFYWQFAVFTGAVFVYPYFIDHLELTYTQIAIYQAIAAVTTLVFGPIWGRIADRVGNRSVLAINTFVAGFGLVGCWMLATPRNPHMIWVSGVVDGIAWSAINAAVFNLALATAEPAKRVSYIAMYSLTSGLAGFLGGVIAGPLVKIFRDYEFLLFGYEWSGYHWLFLISMVLRSMAFLFVRQVMEAKAWRTRELLRSLFNWKLIGFPWR
jgi:MFS family permease